MKRVFNKWLQGEKQMDIARSENVSRTTIWRDLKKTSESLNIEHSMVEQIVSETLVRMIETRNEILNVARESSTKHAHKFYKIVYEIDKTIAEKFPNQTGVNKEEYEKMVESSKAVIDYIVARFGVEQLDDLIDWLERRNNLLEISKNTVTI